MRVFLGRRVDDDEHRGGLLLAVQAQPGEGLLREAGVVVGEERLRVEQEETRLRGVDAAQGEELPCVIERGEGKAVEVAQPGRRVEESQDGGGLDGAVGGGLRRVALIGGSPAGSAAGRARWR